MGEIESIIQEEKECYICHQTYGLDMHHCLHGTANRKKAEQYGLKVWLCKNHHTGQAGVHRHKDLDDFLKRLAQQTFEEKVGSREMFRDEFGKNYL